MTGNLLMNISQNERERALFRSRRKFQTDLQSDLATAEDNGRRIGQMDSKIEIAKNLLKMGLTSDQIAAATGLTPVGPPSLCAQLSPQAIFFDHLWKTGTAASVTLRNRVILYLIGPFPENTKRAA